jgi:hypothetical protein
MSIQNETFGNVTSSWIATGNAFADCRAVPIDIFSIEKDAIKKSGRPLADFFAVWRR